MIHNECNESPLEEGVGGGMEVEVEAGRSDALNMVVRIWDFWHLSTTLTRSMERLSFGTNLTDSAQLLRCSGVHVDVRTKIARCGMQFDAAVQNLNYCQVILTLVNFTENDTLGLIMRWQQADADAFFMHII